MGCRLGNRGTWHVGRYARLCVWSWNHSRVQYQFFEMLTLSSFPFACMFAGSRQAVRGKAVLSARNNGHKAKVRVR